VSCPANVNPSTQTAMSLPTQPLGTSGIEISRVGFGAWAVGGDEWGPQDDNESLAAMRLAIESGVNWIDTAPVYGFGHSERVVARLLRDLSPEARPLVFTKCGLVWDDADPTRNVRQILRPESIRRECEASLRRLGVERIDLYQFHWPDEIGTPVEDSWETMIRLFDEGKIRALGVSNFTVDLLGRCENMRHVDSLQPPFSLIRREVAEREIPWCAAHGTGVIAYSPMQSGLLTDSFTAERVSRLSQEDWRRESSEFREPALSRNLALRDALRPIAARHGTTVAAVAVAWTLACPGLTAAIVGARAPGQVAGWLPAAAVKLVEEDLAEIEEALVTTGAGKGPVRIRASGTDRSATAGSVLPVQPPA
jgi:aryl-alcohol dehydrogenase-like predicted oxidoreductase